MTEAAEPTTKKSGGRGLVIFLAGVFLVAGLGFTFFYDDVQRLRFVLSLYEEDYIVENFRDMDRVFPTGVVHKGEYTHEFPREEGFELPETFEFNGETQNVADFLESTWTTGLVVLKDGAIVYEKYYRGNTEDSLCISWSVAKSFLSALVGIAVEEGQIESIEDPLDKYVPELVGTGYEGVRIKDALQMSAGIYFNEDYGDFNSDINKLGRILALGGSLDGFVASMTRERDPGTFHKYTSTDTQAVAMALMRATGKSMCELLEEKIWKPLGMESDSYYLLDTAGTELALGGLNATTRDYARFGQLYLQKGKWNDEQIVPEQWVIDSVTPDAPHLMPGDNPLSTEKMGYGYQWWIPVEPDGEFLAVGIYNQFIYVYPKLNVVIAKNSAYPGYTDDYESEYETVEMFRAIAKSLSEDAE